MAVRFDSELLLRDFASAAKRHRISVRRAALRVDVQPSVLSRIRTGSVKEITATTMARMLDFIGSDNIGKYTYED